MWNEHHGLKPHAFARQPRFRPPQHGSWAVHRSCLGWAAPCPSGACGEFERPSRSAKDQVAAETARRTCRASDWRPDKRPRTRRSAECGYAPSLFPPSARCSGGTCGSAGRQGGFQSGTALPPCRSAGRQSRLPSGLPWTPGRRRRPHHRGKVAGTRVANAGMGDRRGRVQQTRTSMAASAFGWAPLYPVCAHSSPSGCGSKPDRWTMVCGGPGLLDRLAAKLRCLPVSDHAAKFLFITSCCCC